MCEPPLEYDGLCAAANFATFSVQAKEVLRMPIAHVRVCLGAFFMWRNSRGNVELRGRVRLHAKRPLMVVHTTGRIKDKGSVSRPLGTLEYAGLARFCCQPFPSCWFC